MRTVFIIDDHDIVRFGLRTLLDACPELKVVGEAASVLEGVRGIADFQPDLVISDLSMDASQGLETARAVVAAQAGRPVLIISMHDELIYAEQVLEIGAKGYLMKERAQEFALMAALAVLNGNFWVSPAVNTQLLGRLTPRKHAHPLAHMPARLSTRELEVLEKLGVGKTTKEAAFDLGISARTVDIHRASLKKKLGLKSGAELISWAASHR
ncbi:MAG: response regulator transcription factor [Rhodoferax sp.]|nr:response regulator transcription factor [Rhodoferax sp.]